MVDALENEGVENHSSFHAEELDDNRNSSIWEPHKKLVHEDMESMTDAINRKSQLIPQQLVEKCRSNAAQNMPPVMSTPSSGPFIIPVADLERCEMSQSLDGDDEPHA